eukprot:GHVS01041272.1.p1 GENE.GHVS01041272.1~~GHVS01041272.1.p1  ORF type:complete len:360 (-),score=49.39 GHVS01041272.1:284-1363(-)
MASNGMASSSNGMVVDSSREPFRSHGRPPALSSITSVWIEKYRPKDLSELVGNEQVVNRLKALAQEGMMPNILLAGPPGIGKTSAVYCLCRALLGKNYKPFTLQLNASDDRGIDVVREKIQMFAQKSSNLPPNKHKVVILDEADSMTEGAQQAMRRVMEEYAGSTRFALTCNNSTKIMEALQSRCVIVRYGKLTDEEITKRLLYVCKAEELEYDQDGIYTLVMCAEGDMRNAINNLQATATGFGTVTGTNVLKVCSIPSPELLQRYLSSCCSGDYQKARQITVDLIYNGYSPIDVVGTLRSVLRRYQCAEHLLLEFLKLTGTTQAIMAQGLDTVLQLDKLTAEFCKMALYFGIPPSSQT